MFWPTLLIILSFSIFFSTILVLPLGPSIISAILNLLTFNRVKQARLVMCCLAVLLFCDSFFPLRSTESLHELEKQDIKLFGSVSLFAVFSLVMLDKLIKVMSALKKAELNSEMLTKQAKNQSTGYIDSLTELENLKERSKETDEWKEKFNRLMDKYIELEKEKKHLESLYNPSKSKTDKKHD